MKKIILSLLITIGLLTPAVSFGAPYPTYVRTIIPERTSIDEVGTSTAPFFRGFFTNLFSSGKTDGCAQWSSNELLSTGSACGSGGTWSTTTSQVAGRLINYSNNTNDVVAIGSTATTSAEWWYDPTALIGFLSGKFGIGTTSPYRSLSVNGNAVVNDNVLSSYFVASSTSASSIFPLANITKLSNLTGNGFVKTSGGDGTLSVDTTTYESGLTAGDGLTRTVNDFDCDTASGSVFGCLASADWTTFNNKQDTITAGDALTLTGTDIDFDGGATPSGDLGGTWASPSVTDDSHAHTGATLSGIDISDDTNLTAGTNITLTGDDLSVDDAFILNTGDVGTGSYTFPTLISTNASSSLLSTTYASSTTYFGADLVDCDDPTNSKLLWSDTGRFSCGSDQTGAGGSVDGTGLAGMMASWTDANTLQATSTIVGSHFIATSSTASQLPYASTTMITATTASSSKFIAGSGSASSPTYTFSGDEDTGFYSGLADSFGITTNGIIRLSVSTQMSASNSSGFSDVTTGAYTLNGVLGTISTPTYSFTGDTNTGLWSQYADSLNLTVGGVELFRGDIASTTWFSTRNTFPYASTTMISATTASTTNLVVSGISGSTQCLQASATGVISGTGSACGSGGTVGGFVALATSTSMSIDICSTAYATTSTLALGVASSNIAVSMSGSACLGKFLYVDVYAPNTGLIGTTTFSGVYWDGQINPGSAVVNGWTDKFKFTVTASSTTYIQAKLDSGY